MWKFLGLAHRGESVVHSPSQTEFSATQNYRRSFNFRPSPDSPVQATCCKDMVSKRLTATGVTVQLRFRCLALISAACSSPWHHRYFHRVSVGSGCRTAGDLRRPASPERLREPLPGEPLRRLATPVAISLPSPRAPRSQATSPDIFFTAAVGMACWRPICRPDGVIWLASISTPSFGRRPAASTSYQIGAAFGSKCPAVYGSPSSIRGTDPLPRNVRSSPQEHEGLARPHAHQTARLAPTGKIRHCPGETKSIHQHGGPAALVFSKKSH